MHERVRYRRLLQAAGVVALAATVLVAGCTTSQVPAPSAGSSSATSSVAASAPPSPGAITEAQATYAADWREAWEQQITWTRLVVIGIADNSPSTPQAVARLERNADDMASLMTPYYAKGTVQYFRSQMAAHLVDTIAVARALKTGNQAAATNAEKDWYGNAARIAALLAADNPSIDETATSELLKSHLALTKQEIVDRLAKRWAADVNDYDAIEFNAMKLSDTLSSAIVKQFPSKFQ